MREDQIGEALSTELQSAAKLVEDAAYRIKTVILQKKIFFYIRFLHKIFFT